MTTGTLKMIAAGAMFLDHLRLFLKEFPLCFSWVGRISAPIFLYCSLYSLQRSSNPKRYLKRLYWAGIGMSLVQCLTGFEGNFFRTVFLLQILIVLCFHQDRLKKRIKHPVIAFLLWQVGGFLLCVICGMCSWVPFSVTLFVLPAILGNLFCVEGGFYLILGLMLYPIRFDKKKTAIRYTAFCAGYSVLSLTPLIPKAVYFLDVVCGFSALREGIEYLFHNLVGLPLYQIGAPVWKENYQWMMIFALPVLLLSIFPERRSEKRRRYGKYWLYWFYPLHILLLFLLSV